MSGSRRWDWAAFIGVLVIATCLRAAITAVGPVLPQIEDELGLTSVAGGLLGTIPLLCFAAASPLVHGLTRRVGSRRAVTVALAGIAAAIVLRSVPVPGMLWVGTVLVGVSIAIGNVVVAALVKLSFASRVSLATGLYTAVMGVSASAASGLSVPLSGTLGGWRAGLAAWALPAVVALIVWLWLARTHGLGSAAPAPAARLAAGRTPWRSPVAWQVTVFFGLQSLGFYIVVTWLPTMVVAQGMPARAAGWLLFCFQLVGVVSGPLATALADRFADQRALCAASGLLIALGCAGAVFAPGLVWLWVVLAGIGSGAGFALALALAPLRSRTPEDTLRLAGMSQSVGYLIAAAGPVAAGALGGSAGWGVVVVVFGVFALGQAAFGWAAGRHRYVTA